MKCLCTINYKIKKWDTHNDTKKQSKFLISIQRYDERSDVIRMSDAHCAASAFVQNPKTFFW